MFFFIVNASPPKTVGSFKLQASAGADLLAAAENLGGETPLHLAAKNGSENVLCFLLAAGCWAETKDADGRTPLASACAGGRVGTAAMLLTGEGWAQHQVPESEAGSMIHDASNRAWQQGFALLIRLCALGVKLEVLLK